MNSLINWIRINETLAAARVPGGTIYRVASGRGPQIAAVFVPIDMEVTDQAWHESFDAAEDTVHAGESAPAPPSVPNDQGR